MSVASELHAVDPAVVVINTAVRPTKLRANGIMVHGVTTAGLGLILK
jgi:hypothetical protein